MQQEQIVGDIDALIREEKRLTAAENHSDAWAEGLSAGIEPEIIAETALATAFAELVRSSGAHTAAALAERMRDKILSRRLRDNRHAPLRPNPYFAMSRSR